MTGLLTGFGSVAVIILIGWALGRSRVLGPRGGFAINMVVFWVSTPCLLLHTLAGTDPRTILSAPLAVAAGAALVTALVYGLIARAWLGTRGPRLVVGGLAASYANAANLGIPIAVAVLGDASAVVPVLLFQIALYAPAAMTVLDVLTRPGRGIDWRTILLTPVRNPITVAAIGGLIAGGIGRPLPSFVATPVELLGGAAVPMALLAFGVSLSGSRLLEPGVSPRRAVLLASVLKVVIQPIIGFVLAHVLFGMEGRELLAAVVIAALPTAQNVLTYATRYRVGEVGARDTGVVTTIACVPVVLVIALLLG